MTGEQYRTHHCGELRAESEGREVILSGWVQRVRDTGHIVWIDLRDRYGITQLVVDQDRSSQELLQRIRDLGREFVIRVKGKVLLREAPNAQIPTGQIEVLTQGLEVLSSAKTPPFTIEEQTDGSEELRMQYRYLDLRRAPLRDALVFRDKVSSAIRTFLSQKGFLDVETPFLVRSTPEGARDFIVPSRLSKGSFYALPQSPQIFKQLLMVGGLDKYYQIVRCFRDEDLRSDRQPEFTQLDCEMSFVDQPQVMAIFGTLIKMLLRDFKGVDLEDIPVLSYHEAMRDYGSDKPDLRFDLKIRDLTKRAQGRGFQPFDEASKILAICLPGQAGQSRKGLDAWTEWVKTPQVDATGLVWVKYQEKGVTSSVSKFFSEEDLEGWAEEASATSGDLLLILSGEEEKVRKQMGALRLKVADEMGLRDPNSFKPLWVVDFPLFEKDEETGQYSAMHHPFTAPKDEDVVYLSSAPEKVRAKAYDLVLNGHELGGGSIRIFQKNRQEQVFNILGFSKEEAQRQFGFLMEAFEYGAPPHGGIAFGLDRVVAVLGEKEVIRDFIAFPKNNAARDVMMGAPAEANREQLEALGLQIKGDS